MEKVQKENFRNYQAECGGKGLKKKEERGGATSGVQRKKKDLGLR